MAADPLDSLRLTQIMSNLLSNSCKFAPAGSTVDVTAKWTIAKVPVLARLCTSATRDGNTPS